MLPSSSGMAARPSIAPSPSRAS